MPKCRYINLDYAKYVLEPIFRSIKKGREGDNGENEYTSLPPFMLSNVHFPVPIDSSGRPDLIAQNEIVEKYTAVFQAKEVVSEIRKAIVETTVVLDNGEYTLKHFPLLSVFDVSKGHSKYTKKYGNLHPGPYPVYSASSKFPLTYIDTFDYTGNYLTWSTNGFAGTLLVLDGRFSVNGDRGVLIPKDGRTDINLSYMKYTLEPLFRELAKGRKGDNGEDEFTKLYPSMLSEIMIPIPVDTNGLISIAAQKEIADKYSLIEQYKNEVVSKLSALIHENIEL